MHAKRAGAGVAINIGLKKTTEQKNVSEAVHFLGYVDGADKVAAYRMANLLVVPSRQEAMSIVAVEAGFCGTPVLLTDQCGFSDIQLIDTRLEVSATVTGIAAGLTSLLADSNELIEIAPAWSNFVKQRYSWSSLAPEYFKLYSVILSRLSSEIRPPAGRSKTEENSKR